MIRRATAHDAPDLAALHAESFGDARWSPAQIAASLALATSLAFVAEESVLPQGFILCQMADSETEILTFCVIPTARRKGVGQRLLAAALAAARRQNIARVFLEVGADNEAALAFYAKAGFQPNGTRPGYYRRGEQAIDALMLSLDL